MSRQHAVILGFPKFHERYKADLPVLHIVLNYLSAHWHGRQSLAWSFWVNLVVLRVLVFQGQTMLAPAEGEDYSHWRAWVLAVAVLFHLVFLCWQLVGVVRAADRHFSEHGNMALVWGAQLGATLMFILSTVYVLGAVQMTQSPSADHKLSAESAASLVAHYTVSLSDATRQLSITGDFEPGITRVVRQHLNGNPDIGQITLNSAGGNIFEGRGLSRLFASRGLATHVDELCASACTTAYIGGRTRTASADARFGFHQYRMQVPVSLPMTTADAEQRRDEALFLEAGVSQEFVRTMFDRAADDMWWPPMEALQSGGVIHELQ